MNKINSTTYIKRSHPFAYVTFTDFEKGKGLIQIYSDWGVFGSSWNGMGDRSTEEFVLAMDNSYLSSSLKYWMNYMGVKRNKLELVDKFFDTCWNELKKIIGEKNERTN